MGGADTIPDGRAKMPLRRPGLQAFISYSRIDLARVEPLVAAFHAQNVRAFFDRESVRAGESWPDALARALKRSDHLVLCWSAAAAQSDWVHAEYRTALLNGKGIYPWLLDSTPLPAELVSHQAVREGFESAARQFIKEMRGAERRKYLMSGVASAAVAAGGIGVWFWALPLVRPKYAAAPDYPAFQGSVVEDGSGKPITGAMVTAAGVASTTDSSGHFTLRFREKKPATLHLTIRCPGYAGQDLDVQSDNPDFGIVLRRER